MYIDSHSHFNICMEDGITEKELLDQMAEHHVEYAVQVSTEPENFEWSRKFSGLHSHIFYTLGIHPSSDYSEDGLDLLEETIESAMSEGERLVGVGEIGLDYHWMSHPKEEQIQYFSSQIEMAGKYDLPVIIHSRDAADDTYYVLKGMDCSKVLIHCFSGTREDAKRYLDLGYYISFAGNVTFKKAVELQDALSYVPSDRLFFETDCPFLTPVPHRGKKNRADYVRYVYQFAADYRNEDINMLKETIQANFKTFFKVPLL